MSMPYSIKPPMWNWTPEFCETPCLASGLTSLFPFWEFSGEPYDYIRKKYGTRIVKEGVGLPGWKASKRGSSMDFQRYNGVDMGDMQEIIPNGYVGSFFIFFFLDEISGAGDPTLLVSSSDTMNGHLPYRDGKFYLDWWDNIRISGSSASDKELTSVAATKGYRNGTKFWHNGELVGLSSQSGISVPSENLILNGIKSSKRGNYTDLFLCAFWNRELTETEVMHLTADPFAMLRPRSDL